MKKTIFCLLFFLAAAAGAFSQKTVQLNYAYSGFNALDVSNAFTVYVEKSNEYSIVVTADDHLAEDIKATVSGGTLYLSLNNKHNNIKTLKAYVTMPEIADVKLSGASDLFSEDMFAAEKFTATLSGASNMKLNMRANAAEMTLSGASDIVMDIETTDLKVKASGASDAKLSGKAMNASITCSGSSDCIASDMVIGDAVVKASGSSDVKIKVENSLDVSASGASSVTYYGNPTIKSISSTGASSVKKR